jgi:hypothetical protein
MREQDTARHQDILFGEVGIWRSLRQLFSWIGTLAASSSSQKLRRLNVVQSCGEPFQEERDMSQRKLMVTGVFRNRLDAERAFEYLNQLGYNESDINVLMSDKSQTTAAPLNPAEERIGTTGHAAEGAGVGGAIGTILGATAAGIAAIGSTLAIPGLGLIVAGPVAAALAGAGVGAVTGGVIGGLVGAGLNEQNADAYLAALRDGGVVIGVAPHGTDDIQLIQKKFEEFNGESVCYG